MFGRRVFGSAPIPKAMYRGLHINTSAQAARLLPTLIPLVPSLCQSSPASFLRSVQCSSTCGSPLDITAKDPVLLKAFVESLTSLQLGYLRLLELWSIARINMVTKATPVMLQAGV